MNWRSAASLLTLRDQLNAEYPDRSKVSDGFIGDAAHAASGSDHNPNAEGVVCAFDITHSPQSGLDAHALADRLVTNRHPNLKYVISNGRIAGWFTNWRWLKYSGGNPHSSHIHVSVGVGDDGKSVQPYDDTTKWNIGGDMVIGSGDNWYWRFNRLHHQLVRNGDMSRDVFNGIVGRDAWSVIESWSDHPEANQLIEDQKLGEQARRDNWPGQIYALQEQLKAVQQALDNEKAKPPKEVVKEVEKIVERTVAVPVLVHDQETKESVSQILKFVKSIWGSLTSLHKKVK